MPPARRRAGPVETAVRHDLRGFPADMQRGAIAKGMLLLGRRLDSGVSARDLAQGLRELRLCVAQLREMAPGEVKGDAVDELRARREQRMAGEQ